MGAIWVNAGYQKRETLRVELKSDLKRLPDPKLIDTVMALSNTEGGELYIGVEDNGTPTGVHKTHSDATQLNPSDKGMKLVRTMAATMKYPKCSFPFAFDEPLSVVKPFPDGNLVAYQAVHAGNVDDAAVLRRNHGLLGHCATILCRFREANPTIILRKQKTQDRTIREVLAEGIADVVFVFNDSIELYDREFADEIECLSPSGNGSPTICGSTAPTVSPPAVPSSSSSSMGASSSSPRASAIRTWKASPSSEGISRGRLYPARTGRDL